MTPSQRARRRKAVPRRSPGRRYTTQSYGYAIYRGCDGAFPPPEPLRRLKVVGKKGRRWERLHEWKERLGAERWSELKRWREGHRWSPNQLRHNAATFLRKQFGIEAARVVLGHASAGVTEVYAELDLHKAAEVMAKVG